MTIGPTAPVDSIDQHAQALASMERRIADLERAAGRARASALRFAYGQFAASGILPLTTTATTVPGLSVTINDLAPGDVLVCSVGFDLRTVGAPGTNFATLMLAIDGVPFSYRVALTSTVGFIVPVDITCATAITTSGNHTVTGRANATAAGIYACDLYSSLLVEAFTMR